jgi:hypothetical protein
MISFLHTTEAKPILDKIKGGWEAEEKRRQELQEQLMRKAGIDHIDWANEKAVQARCLHVSTRSH